MQVSYVLSPHALNGELSFFPTSMGEVGFPTGKAHEMAYFIKNKIHLCALMIGHTLTHKNEVVLQAKSQMIRFCEIPKTTPKKKIQFKLCTT